MSPAVVETEKADNSEPLQDAFQLFNEPSRNLTESCHGLHRQVADRYKETAAARLKTPNEKERPANRFLSEASPGGVILADASGTVIRDNRGAEERLGTRRDQILEQPSREPGKTPRERKSASGCHVNISTHPLGDKSGRVPLPTDVSAVLVSCATRRTSGAQFNIELPFNQNEHFVARQCIPARQAVGSIVI